MSFTKNLILNDSATISRVATMGMDAYGDKIERIIRSMADDNTSIGEYRDSKRRFGDASMNGVGFLTHNLAYIMAGAMLVQYPELTFRSLVSIDTNVPRLTREVGYDIRDYAGGASFNVDLSTDDVPFSNTSQGRTIARIYDGTIGQGYSIDELAMALQNGVRLDAERMLASREGTERTLNRVALLGDTGANVKGLLNQATGANKVKLVAAAQEWFDLNGALKSGTTIEKIRKDIDRILTAVMEQTNFSVIPNTLGVPSVTLGNLASIYTGTNSDVSLLDLIKKSNVLTARNVTLNIVGIPELDGAGATTNSFGKKLRMVAYNNSSQNMLIANPRPLEFIAPQQVNFSVKLLAYYSMSAVIIKRVESIAYMDAF